MCFVKKETLMNSSDTTYYDLKTKDLNNCSAYIRLGRYPPYCLNRLPEKALAWHWGFA